MRLWSLHPSLLDRAALVAGWREALLGQKVLRGMTTGYRNHPQLARFRAVPDPVAAMAVYLHGLADEADARGYRFDRQRIVELDPAVGEAVRDVRMPVTTGQLDHEWAHLMRKLDTRAPDRARHLAETGALPVPHPLFVAVPGAIEPWEVI